MPRFVVLRHDHPFLHWDFMLEQGETLRAWRLMKPPADAGAIVGEALGEHRRAYLDYEGPVSGGRGQVNCWDKGDYETLSDDGDRIELALKSEKLNGQAVLERTPEPGSGWRFQFLPS